MDQSHLKNSVMIDVAVEKGSSSYLRASRIKISRMNLPTRNICSIRTVSDIHTHSDQHNNLSSIQV